MMKFLAHRRLPLLGALRHAAPFAALAVLAQLVGAQEALAGPFLSGQQGDLLRNTGKTLDTMVDVLQGLAFFGCTVAIIRAGLRFTKVNEYENAIDHMKSTLIACAIVGSAVGIVEYFQKTILKKVGI